MSKTGRGCEVNFTLVQFVPGGPVEQAIARAQGQGDVLEGITGAGSDAGVDDLSTGSDSQYIGYRIPC